MLNKTLGTAFKKTVQVTTLCINIAAGISVAQAATLPKQVPVTELTQSTTDSVLSVLNERIYKVSEIQGLLNANPANLSSWCNLSMASFENKDFKIAQTAALQALILQPHYRDIWILVKNACEQNKQETCQKNAEIVLQELQYIR